jgi:ABC-type cobalamin/Fe3+-siderophores transport system ATPase subunit
VEILMELAQKRGTAVIMTIHQPRQNIFARYSTNTHTTGLILPHPD